MLKDLFGMIVVLFVSVNIAFSQPTDTKPATTPAGPSTTVATTPPSDSVQVTVILKHQQDKNLSEIRRILEAQGFWEMFPPKSAKVLSWNIAMGFGHIIMLELPASDIRTLNLAIQNGAWGAYNSEIYISYNYKPIWEEYVEKREEAKAEREEEDK